MIFSGKIGTQQRPLRYRSLYLRVALFKFIFEELYVTTPLARGLLTHTVAFDQRFS